MILALSILELHVRGQGIFTYDQQSADENGALEGSVGLGQQPLGQSFTPNLSTIGFIRLYIYDGVPGGGGRLIGAKVTCSNWATKPSMRVYMMLCVTKFVVAAFQ